MKFLTFIKTSEKDRDKPIPQALNEAMGPFVGAAMASGKVTETGGLKPSKEGFRIRSRGGKLTRTDGPFTESKEVIGGFAIFNVASRAEAEKMATDFMELHRKHWPELDCECEVRQFDE